MALNDRLFDLLPIVRKRIYHAFRGRFSIKEVLPAMVPDMLCEGLDIGDGATAIAKFAKMATARYSPEDAQRVRADLLEYCKQDTLAMAAFSVQ